MKRFLILVFAATLTACNNNGYVVTGEIPDAADSSMVIMIESLTGMPKDTAFIKDGKFTFTGDQKEPAMRHLIFNRSILTAIVLENSKITISKTEIGYEASGSALNDTLRIINNKLNMAYKEMDMLEKKYAPNLPAEEKSAIETKYHALNDQIKQMCKDATASNISNTIGIYMLFNSYDSFEAEELQGIINQIPETVIAGNPNLQRIKISNDAAVKTSIGKAYTDLELSAPDGKTVKLSDLMKNNKVTLIDFWASWCGPCRSEMPNVINAYNQFKDKGFGIVGISLDSNAEAWKTAIGELGMTWAQMSDLKGWKSLAAETYGVTSIPHTILIDNSTGAIIARDLRGNTITEKLSEIFSK